MSEETMKVSLKRQKVNVIFDDGEGQESKGILRELLGKERNKYLDKMTNRAKVSTDGKVIGIKNFDGFQADLLKDSLFHENEELFSIEEIEALPASTQQKLFERSQKLSGLDQDASDTEKND